MSCVSCESYTVQNEPGYGCALCDVQRETCVCFVVFCFKFYPTFAFAAKGTHKPEVALYISGENNSIPYILKSLRVSTQPYLPQASMRSQVQRCFKFKTLDVLKFSELF